MTEGMIQIDPVLCTGCKRCADNCPTHAIEGEQGKAHKVCEEKCVACGQCVQTCSAYDSVFDANLTPRDVLFKERCLPLTLTEPLFAAWDRNCLAEVKATLADAGVFPIVQCDSTVLSAIPEDFGYASGTLPPGRMAGALRKLGFRKVYNTNLLGAFAVREESHDLIERLQSGRRLPVIDSSCPAAVKYIEQAYPELIYHLTTCRSPQQIGGALYKSYGAKMWGVGPGSIYSVSVGPCTSRKLEAGRNTPRASLPASAGGAPLAALPDGKADLQGKSREADAVLTTRELAYLLKDAGVDPFAASSEEFDQDLLDRSWLSHVYCSTGDIAQAVLETCCELLNREVRSPLNLASADAGADGARVTSVETDGYEIKALSVSGLGSAIPFLDAIKAGKIGFAFMEVRACPAGCVSGGGQPKVLLPKDKPRAYIERATVTSLTSAGDRVEITEDSTVQRLYVKHFGMPCGDKSNRILHTPWE